MHTIYDQTAKMKCHLTGESSLKDSQISRKLDFKKTHKDSLKTSFGQFKNFPKQGGESLKPMVPNKNDELTYLKFLPEEVQDTKNEENRERIIKKFDSYMKKIIQIERMDLENKKLEAEKIIEQIKKTRSLKVEFEDMKEELNKIRKEMFILKIDFLNFQMERDGNYKERQENGVTNKFNYEIITPNKNNLSSIMNLILKRRKKFKALKLKSRDCKNCEFKGSCSKNRGRCGFLVNDDQLNENIEMK